MFVKLQLLDANCIPVLGSSTKLPCKGVPRSPPENFHPVTHKTEEHKLPHCPNGGVRWSRRVQRNPRGTRDGEKEEPGLKKQGLQKNLDGGVYRKSKNGENLSVGNGVVTQERVQTKCSTKWVNYGGSIPASSDTRDGEKQDPGLKKQGLEKNLNGGVYRKRRNVENLTVGNGVVTHEKVQTKCSKKWVKYGGSIPAILNALDTFRDLDEALRPWEERLSNKERSIILKEQVRILGKAQKWSHVESLWNEMKGRGIAATNSTYGTLIDVYSKGGLKEDALVWLESMLRQGMEPDEVTMVIVVQLYKKAGEFRKAEDFFRKWSSGELLRQKSDNTLATSEVDKMVLHSYACLSSHTYNTLIDTYGKAGQLKEASETFTKMLKQGLSPTTVTFNTMIHICGNHGQLEEVRLLLQKMEELKCPPDTRTYNILISLHTKHNNIAMAAKYLSKMKEARLEPDLVSYRTLLYAYSIRQMIHEAEELISEMDEEGLEIDQFTQSALTRMYIEAGLLEQSWLWFRRFHLSGNMTSECYSANIDAYGEHGHTLEAEKVFLCCRERKKLSVLHFNVMIKAYGIGECYDKACRLFDSIEKHGIIADRCSYSSLIQILASADQPHIAKIYLKKMQEAGLVNDCIPYCAVISSFVKLSQLEMAEELYKQMIKHAVHPDIIVYGVLINAFADAGSVKEAINYVDDMRRAGLPGNAVIYNSLIKLYTKVGYLKEAQETYKLLQSTEEGPTVYSSNCMLDLYTKRSMVEQAKEIFESVKKKGSANEFTFAMMLNMYKKIGRLDEAIQIAKEMGKLGLLTDILSYNSVLGLYAMDGRTREAVETFKEMIGASIQPDDCTFRSLSFVLLKCGVSKQAIRKLEVMMKTDASRGLKAWMSTLSCVLDVEDYDDE
ncbi:pentatricopeptide repeat-containing protein [Senna tora]|uniref:Pentatricopeptide repeat-containing protein n=1 Tax=Senna tora TaxID=362788 RepID=A0A834T5P4_9FABA|nr:pentatricopeptide repeat-containing protein [Senna tora]